jgi:hypothetical protein
LNAVERILLNARHPTFPAGVSHKYDDKYGLVDMITNIALAAQINNLEVLGATQEHLATIKQWSLDRSVTLRLKAEHSCAFVKEVSRKVESPKYHAEVKTVFGKQEVTEKVVTTVIDYYWKFDAQWEVFLFRGNDPNEKVCNIVKLCSLFRFLYDPELVPVS